MSPSILHSASRSAAKIAGVVLLIAPAASALPQGPEYRALQDFITIGGYGPEAGVIQGQDGAFYGTTNQGGVSGLGLIFKMSADGSVLTDLHDFSGPDGSYPNGLVQGNDGFLFGTCQAGGANAFGTVFKIATDGTGFLDLLDFDGANAGQQPYDALFESSDGLLYGSASLGGAYGYGTAFRMRLDGSKFTKIWDFDGATNGAFPFGSLMQASDGNFYVTTENGGSQLNGTICQLHPTIVVGGVIWSCTTIFNFDDLFQKTGLNPRGTLLQGADGFLYGTAASGGSHAGYGTLYRLATDGSGFSVLHDFDSTFGANPMARGPLVQLPDGTLYGTTQLGGANSGGTVFKMNPDGSGFIDLFDFNAPNSSSGALPWDVIAGADGNIYGTTWVGQAGTNAADGVIYELVLHPASWTNYGAGLAGTLGVPAFFSNADPVLGTTITLTLGNSRGVPTFSVVLAGLNEAKIPYKGGDLYVSNYVAIVPLTLPSPSVDLDFSVPNDPSLAGLEVDLQTLEIDPGAVKGNSLTQGLQLLLGW